MPTAAILVVGDEILEGHTHDTNSHYLAQRLMARGITVRRIVTCSDDVDDIASQLERIVRDGVGLVFVAGGIGPTPDDRTYEAVAIAAGVPLIVTQDDEAWLRQRCQDRGYATELLDDPQKGEALWRMVRRPEGSRRVLNPVGMALGSAASIGGATVFVLPGVPRELRAMMEQEIEASYLTENRPAHVVAEIEHVGQEARLYGLMRDVEARFAGIKLGSYPQDNKGRVILRLQGPAALVDGAADALLAALSGSRRTR